MPPGLLGHTVQSYHPPRWALGSARMQRRLAIRLVGNHAQAHVHPHPRAAARIACRCSRKATALGTIHTVEMVHVVPDDQHAIPPQPEVFHVTLDFLDRRIVVEVMVMGGKVDAADQLLRNGCSSPRARRETALVVTRGPQQLPHAVKQPPLIVADDPPPPGRSSMRKPSTPIPGTTASSTVSGASPAITTLASHRCWTWRANTFSASVVSLAQPGKLSVRNGNAGKPARLYRLHTG